MEGKRLPGDVGRGGRNNKKKKKKKKKQNCGVSAGAKFSLRGKKKERVDVSPKEEGLGRKFNSVGDGGGEPFIGRKSLT